MSVEALRAQWLNRRVLHEWYPGYWEPACVTWISNDGKHVAIDYESVIPDGSIRSCLFTSSLGVCVRLIESQQF
jgi:hypothetical protein